MVPGVLAVARLGIVAAAQVASGEPAPLGQRLLHLVGERNAGLAAGEIVDHDRVLAAIGEWSNSSGQADLADGGGAEALAAGPSSAGVSSLR